MNAQVVQFNNGIFRLFPGKPPAEEVRNGVNPEAVLDDAAYTDCAGSFLTDIALYIPTFNFFIICLSRMTGNINIGCGVDLTIAELSNKIAKIIEYNGKIKFDTSQPDGTPQKLLDVSRLKNLGWQPSISLEEGIKLAYGWYLKNVA